MKHYHLAGLLCAGSVILLLAVSGCGGGGGKAATGASHRPVTIHGRVILPGGTAAAAEGGSRGEAACYAIRVAGSGPSAGRQVIVYDPSGKVIGTGALGRISLKPPCSMAFTVTGVPHEVRYGFGLSGVAGKHWTTSVSKPVTLTVGGG